MKQLSEKTKNNLNKTAFALSVIFASLFGVGSLLFFIYSIVLTVATESATYFFFTFGLCTLSAEFFILFFCAAFYVFAAKLGKSYLPNEHKKNFDTSKIVLAIFAVIFLIISLATQKTYGFAEGKSNYLVENGYYAEAKKMEIGIFDTIDQIDVTNSPKTVVIKKAAVSNLSFLYYDLYENQVKIEINDGVLSLSASDDPKRKTALNDFCFFLFNESKNEKQLIIYIPNDMSIAVKGNFIEANN